MPPTDSPAPNVFSNDHPELGSFALRPLDLEREMPLVHSWVTGERARYWGMVGKSLEQVTLGYREIAKTAQVFLGLWQGRPAFLVETYFPGDDPVAAHFSVQPGDRGMHVLLAPTQSPVRGFSWAVFCSVMDFVFSEAAAKRVVVEPDVRNAKIHALNRRAGFRYAELVELPNKLAHLAFCTREDYVAALGQASPSYDSARTLDGAWWDQANRALLKKALSELSHERLLTPLLRSGDAASGSYQLDAGPARYSFAARRLPLDHWDIEPSSISRTVAGDPAPLDALDFVLEFRDALGVREEMLPVYLEEVTATLRSLATRYANERLSSADLLHGSFQELESGMNEGHPVFLANSGRVGFDLDDVARYAPESAARVRLVWLAAQRAQAEFNAVDDIGYEQLLEAELGSATLARFRAVLEAKGLDWQAYVLMPVHPWQWFNKLALAFAGDIAHGRLVCLGESDDEYQAQQSVRTFFNLTSPSKHYVKTALSVLNMGFMRGLSPDYMRGTPAINAYLEGVLAADPLFSQKGFRLLKEVAAVGYRNQHFEALPAKSSHKKMLAALWRESPLGHIAPGQRLMTMAALLHRDRNGVALLPLLVRASGLDPDTWLTRYLEAYLVPLLHCLYAYDLAFMPHGENLILVLEEHAVVGVFMKDIGEEAAIMDAARVLPERVQRLRVEVPDSMKWLSIFTDVFDGFFRFLSQILSSEMGYSTAQFWSRVRRSVADYQASQPELAYKFARYPAFASAYPHSCLNRLQLRNNRQLVDLADPANSLAIVGVLANPLTTSA